MTAPTYLNCINGAMTASASGQTYPMHNPATGELLGHAQLSTAGDMAAAVQAARTAWEQSAWRHDSALRGRVLLDMARLIGENKERLARLYTMNNGKTITEARNEVANCADVFVYTAGAARSIYGRSIDPVPGTMSVMVREPVGVVGVISPWNWPIQLMVREMVPALAAGNAVVLKPASMTAAVSMAFVELLCSAAELPAGIVNAVTGSGPAMGEVLCTAPEVKVISFTGSGPIGAEISRMAAPGFKKVLLELGGKSPNVVFADAELDKVIPGAITAAFLTSGQLCMAGTRLLVQDTVHDEVVRRMTVAM